MTRITARSPLSGAAAGWLLLTVTASLLLVGCGDDEEEGLCRGAKIFPHLSPVNFGEAYPTDPDDIQPGNAERTPFEWVLLLQSPCEEAVTVSDVCLVGEEGKNGSDTDQFTIEGSKPDTITAGTEGAVRLTYSREAPVDADNDGVQDIDSVAIVIQSNADNFPTLVVPVCVRVVPEGTTRMLIECESPVTVEPGARDDDLCGG